ncbi:DUF1592 domain-containing protein [Brevifollis gellanilyticus]|uniref:DUF1592 domain-containing protein n=1 Tax=Brevifollis gellanilyticus TaxID=748831 RepID=A0A512MF21_9BACT|nr:DUF1592 domain-containing protein [Brevifollis gellanilyticus]GEP45333.1 hypothetical protein BGE01nite_46240 [Brevifollis gellanilyticus]
MTAPRLLLPLALLLPLPSMAAENLATRGQAVYEQKIKPLLEQYCYDCHSDGVDKGNFLMDDHKDYASMRADFKMWDHVRQQLITHVMPPEKKDKPSLVQRDELVAWIDDAVFWFDPSKPDPGHITARRLNRTEYNNTIRDLLFVDTRPAKEFPPDDTGYGFDNIADVLSLSPMLMEKYLRASRAVAEDAFDVSIPDHTDVEIGAGKMWNSKGKTEEHSGIRWFYSPSEASAKVKAPAGGNYLVTLHIAATESGNEPAKIALRVNGKDVSTFDVTTRWKDDKGPWQKIIKTVQLNGGDSTISVAFLNDHADPANPDPDKRDRNVALDKIDVQGPTGLLSPRGSKFLRWLLNDKPVGLPTMLLTGEDFDKGEGDAAPDTGGIVLASSGYVKRAVQITEPGKYKFTLKAGAQQAGDEPAKTELRIAGKTIGAFSVTAKNQAAQWFNVEADLPVGAHELQVWFTNDFYDEKSKQDRNLWVHQVKIEGPLNRAGGIQVAEVPALVEKLGTRLFRRPIRDDEKAKWQAFAELAMKEGETPLGALRYVLEGMLVSPAYLFRISPQPAGAVQDGIAEIDEFSLANRLSYFLWSAPPDDRLLQLAANKELRKNLPAEMKRLIGDWHAYAITEDFAGQWLQLRDMDIVSPDSKRFPEWKGGLGYSMKRESQAFFDHILRENRPVIDFLNADYTFLDSKLANYYGIGGVKGDKFQKVSLQGTPRGGILTQGSILTLTSEQTRTSPVKRGKYLLENILGTPPPPAPGGVPPLDEKKARFGNVTLREQLAEHRSNASCAGCHAFLDPMGFAFENFDAIGRYRTEEKKHPIDASGQLVRGQTFKDLAELRVILARDMADDFTRSLAENLLTYALGRGLNYSDKPAVHEIVRRTKAADYKFQEMLLAVIESAPFQKMRVGEAE